MKGERALIEAIDARLSGQTSEVRLGIGDDAAVLAPSAGGQVLSVDACVDGVHFRRDLLTLADAGYRAFVGAASDLAAMGARPRAALLSLVVPEADAGPPLLELVDGVAEASRDLRLPVVGGNLAAGATLSISTTVVGEAPDHLITRKGATPGDQIYITGHAGTAALGLALLLDGGDAKDRPEAADFIARWRRPTAELVVGQRLAGHVTAGIDVSDGILSDLGHLCDASGVGADLYAGELPLLPGFEALCGAVGEDPLAVALGGGEEYSLLFTAPADATPKELATRIGIVTEGSGVRVLDAEGRDVTPARAGYEHFAASS